MTSEAKMRSLYPEIRPIIQSSPLRTRLKRLNPVFQVWKMLLDVEDFIYYSSMHFAWVNIRTVECIKKWLFIVSCDTVGRWFWFITYGKKGFYIYFYLFSATGGRFPLLPMLLPSCWPTNFTHTQVVFVHFVHSPPANQLMKGFILVSFWLALYSSLFGWE